MEIGNLESSAISNGSYTSENGTDALEKKHRRKKGTKRGRRFDRDSRAAELQVCS